MLLQNSWLYKLKHHLTTKSTSLLSKSKQPPSPFPPPPSPSPIYNKSTQTFSYPRKSYYYSPKKSPKRLKKTSFSSSSSTLISYSSSEYSSTETEYGQNIRSDSSLVSHQNNEDIAKLNLPPIKTKPRRNFLESKPIRKSVSSYSPGVKLRVKSPKMVIRSRKSLTKSRKSSSSSSGLMMIIDGSFAVVKSSLDPEKDFRESMAEMILQKNIKESKDLEDLLACYLCLNSDEYHYLIIKN
ncbi:hypothetical protein ACFE04_000808 [Oxalis oulophora]